jgi:PRTRC genetic system protein E
MFKELVPVLRDRAVLLTVTLVEADQIRVNIVPKKLKDGDNDALTTPLSVTGTAEELDAQLAPTLVGYPAFRIGELKEQSPSARPNWRRPNR